MPAINDNAEYPPVCVVLVAGKSISPSKAANHERPATRFHNQNPSATTLIEPPQQTHRHPASDGSAYKEYVLTERGRAVFLIVVSMRQWGEQHLFQTGEVHSVLLDKAREQPVVALEVRSAEGRRLGPEDCYRGRVVKGA